MYKPTIDPGGEWDVIEIEGRHARGFCNVAMTNDVYALGPGESQPTWVLEPDGRLMSPAVLRRPGEGSTCFQLLVRKSAESRVAHWLRALSDGYVHMDDDDPFAKAPGPVVVRRLPRQRVDEWETRPLPPEAFGEESQGGPDEGWAFHKPYWIGRRPKAAERAQAMARGLELLPAFSWERPFERPLQRSILYEVRVQADAGSGGQCPTDPVQEEQRAVRKSAGLFDISHLGLFEFSGDNVHLFLNTITTNDVSLLDIGQAQYSFMLDAEGKVLDDVYLYRLEKDCYWMTVNAANADQDWAWVNAVRESQVRIDPERPWSRALGTEKVSIRNLRDERVLLALQGPRSRDILLSMLDDTDPLCERLLEAKRNEIFRGRLAGYDLYLSRTGYAGEPMAFEILVHPAAVAALWRALLKAGEPLGLMPAGLAARDSLRIEAGLPLHGHELAGPLDLNPADASFDPYVKLYKPFFVGKAAYVAHERERQAQLIRFRLNEQEARMPGQGDVVVSRAGQVVGTVTSCCVDSEGWLTGLAYVQKQQTKPGIHLAVFQSDSRSWTSKPLSDLKPGDRVQLHDNITVIRRFLNKAD
jgi:glycine hydroxymethyltransferase